jgi:tetraacyldisaccharide 4'-kinase
MMTGPADKVTQAPVQVLSWQAPEPEPPPTLDWPLLLYNMLVLLAAPVLVGYMLWRLVGPKARRGKSGGGWGERLGFVPAAAHYRAGRPPGRPERAPRPAPRIWLHGVSVGEVAVAACLLAAIKRRLPEARVFVTTTTPTGRQIAERSCAAADAIFYFPFDFVPGVERALRLVRPDVCVLLESEVWPNFLAAARRRGIATVVVNGRISERTWRRLRRLGPLFRWALHRVDRFCMQSQTDADRVVCLGASPDRVSNLGNIKFDQVIPRVTDAEREEIARQLGVAGARSVIMAASTHPGEEKIALDAFRVVREFDPDARLVIALRHIERAAEVEQLVAQAGLRSRRRSAGPPAQPDPADTVVILDTIGELERFYCVATVAFVGGSFVTIGGHNVLQATAQGVPCIVGPYMHNFREIADLVISAGVGFQVQRPEELGPMMVRLLADRHALQAIARSCETALAAHRGAAERCALAAEEMLTYRCPAAPASLGVRLRAFVVGALSGADHSLGARSLVALLAPLSALYWVGLKINRLMYSLGLARAERLPARVVSIGNLSAGGTGKTSGAALLAGCALRQGWRPAILSRGYGCRRARGESAVVSNGGRVLADATIAGDEPLLLARKVAGAAVLVGKNRRETGRQAVADLGAEVLILDDGFQYWRLAKDREIVLIDALAPFGTGLLLPAGILREPLSHLPRAHAVWLTHTDLAGEAQVAAIRARVKRYFGGELIETIHRPVGLRSLDGEQALDLAGVRDRPVIALSGIGNPLAFELTLRRLGARVSPLRFPDHHPYTEADCRAIDGFARRRGAIIVTTEKDAVRLRASAFSTPMWVLAVELVARDGGDLAAGLAGSEGVKQQRRQDARDGSLGRRPERFEPWRVTQQLLGRIVLLTLARHAHLIPRRAVFPLARALGSAVMAISPRHRRIVMDNLRLAFGAERSELELRVIARRFYHNFMRGLLEFLRLPTTSPQEIIASNRLEGLEHLQQALARGHGAVLFSAHYGNWETVGARLALAGYRPLYVIARNQRDQEVTELLASLRRHGGLAAIPRDGAIGESVRLLNANQVMGMLIDQNVRVRGIFVPFFGKLAATAAGAAVIASRTEAPFIPIFCIRQPDGTQVGRIGPPIELQRTGDLESDIIANTALLTGVIERAIREHPDHWFWVHQRWKSRPPWEDDGSDEPRRHRRRLE